MKNLMIPIGKSVSWNEELKYVLRSWDKYADIDKVFLVGVGLKERYPWLKNSKIIECDDPFVRNKDGNIIRKIIKAIDSGELSDPFIRSSDDQYLLKQIEDFSPVYSVNLKEKDPNWWRMGSRWKNRLKRTYRVLFVKGKTTFNYDVHFPMEVGHDFKKIMESYPYMKSVGYCVNTLYFNNALKKHVKAEGHQKSEGVLAYIERPLRDENRILDRIKGKSYLCYSAKQGDLAMTEELKNVIRKKFKKKSKFEK